MRQLFGTDGIRAVAGEAPLDAATVYAVGRALARHVNRPDRAPAGQGDKPSRVVMGMDTRESSAWIAATLAAGLRAEGAEVDSAGVMTTPGVAYLVQRGRFAAGVVISASHNPWQDNGIKIFGPDGYKLPDPTELELERTILALRERQPPSDLRHHAPPTQEEDRVAYVQGLLAAVPGVSLGGRRISIDCANGAASAIAPQLFEGLGGTLYIHHASPNGRNINEHCGALHPEVVAKLVQEDRADLGMTFDGDADRSLFADEHGRVVNGDAILLIAARDLQSRGLLAGDVVVATTMSNMGLEAALRRSGIRMERAPVGDKYVLERMQSTGASLGGEQSGHILFPHKSTTGDGLLTALILIDILNRTGRKLSELVADLKTFPQVIVNVKVREKLPLENFPLIASRIAEAEQVLNGTGRVVIRYSGTEALARVMIEAEDEEQMRRHADQIAAAIRQELGA